MKITKLIPYGRPDNPNITNGYGRCLFAVVDQNKTVLQSLQTCKDYCSDLLHNRFWNPEKQDLARDKPRFTFLLPDQYKHNSLEIAENILDCVNQIEKDLNFQNKTVFYQVKYNQENINTKDVVPGLFCVVGASEWMYSLPLYSLFQTIIRSVCGIHVKGEKYDDTFKKIIASAINPITNYTYDTQYLSEGVFLLKLFIKYGYKKFFYDGEKGFDKNWSISQTGGTSHSGGISGMYKYIFFNNKKDHYKGYILHKYFARPELLKEIEQLEGKILFPRSAKGDFTELSKMEDDQLGLGYVSLYQ